MRESLPFARLGPPLLLLLATALLPVGGARAVELAPPFGDGMVLQRGVPVPIWGTAKPREEVTLRFRGQVHRAEADAKGHWRVTLDPIRAGRGARMRIDGASKLLKDALILNEVWVGELWLGVGEANIGAPVSDFVRQDMSLAQDLASAPHDDVRLYTMGSDAGWEPANAMTIRRFSALMFTFGLRLRTEVGVAVGLIVASQEESTLARWLTPESLKEDAAFAKAMSEGRAQGRTGDLFESRIRPLVPFALAGVLWDQGESGVGFERMPTQLAMKGLIEGWRKAWGREDLPFLYVQKPNGGGPAADPKDRMGRAALPVEPVPAEQPSGFSGAIRGNWIAVSKLPHTAMVTTSDLGSGPMPEDKWAYGVRAATVARGFVYDQDVLYYGPTYVSHAVQGRSIRVQFDHVGKGLTYRQTPKLTGFAIAGADRVFHWADARIQGDSVVVTSPSVPQPRFVRYGWAVQRPWANLFNEDGLPALAFSVGN